MTAPVIDAGDDLALTVPRLVRARVAERPDAPFLATDGGFLTYRVADDQSAALARALLGAGVGAGSRVAILHPNGPAFVVAWLAAARIGAVSVPLSTFSTSAELVGLLRGADASILLAAPGYRNQDYLTSLREAVPELDLGRPGPLLSPTVPSLRRLVFATEEGDGLDAEWTMAGLLAGGDRVSHDALAAAEDLVTPADPMVIVHTSGSTSEPKGVIHTHGALLRHLDNLNQLRRYTPDEVLFSNSPFFWIGGFAYALLGTLVAGAELVCSASADASDVLDLIEREQPTMVNGFAASVAHLPEDPSFSARDLSSIRRGNLHPIMPPAVRPADPELRHNMLGMTEAGSVCLASEDESEQPEHRRGSFGRPVPGFEADVREGELWFRGPFLFDGYDGRERHETFDPDGWFATGDLVTVDEEGFVYFRGRGSDMIKTAGANVSPREVEAAIAEEAGLTAHVVGLDDPDRGQVVAALVRAPEGMEVDIEDLRSRLRDRLSAYKVPRTFLVIADADVPMLSSGKLDQRAVKELFGAP